MIIFLQKDMIRGGIADKSTFDWLMETSAFPPLNIGCPILTILNQYLNHTIKY